VSAVALGWRRDLDVLCADGRPAALAVVSLLRCLPPYTRGSVAEVAAATGYAYGTVSSFRWLARHVPADVQRDDLTAKHHFAVAAHPAAEQRRLLARAADLRLTPVELCRLIAEETAS
jgi:hypothetical protein